MKKNKIDKVNMGLCIFITMGIIAILVILLCYFPRIDANAKLRLELMKSQPATTATVYLTQTASMPAPVTLTKTVTKDVLVPVTKTETVTTTLTKTVDVLIPYPVDRTVTQTVTQPPSTVTETVTVVTPPVTVTVTVPPTRHCCH